mgnify:CR=1 FL=1
MNILITGCFAPGTPGTVYGIRSAKFNAPIKVYGCDSNPLTNSLPEFEKIVRLDYVTDEEYLHKLSIIVKNFKIDLILIQTTKETILLSQLDKNFFDANRIPPNEQDRVAIVKFQALTTQGLDTKGIQDVQLGLNQASSFINNVLVDNVDEAKVVAYMSRLQTYSDITDIDNAIKAQGKWSGIEDFLNDQLADDANEMKQVANHLKELAVKSGKQPDTIRTMVDSMGLTRISIGLGN